MIVMFRPGECVIRQLMDIMASCVEPLKSDNPTTWELIRNR